MIRLVIFLTALLLMPMSACMPALTNQEGAGIDQNEVATIVAATLQAEFGQSDQAIK